MLSSLDRFFFQRERERVLYIPIKMYIEGTVLIIQLKAAYSSALDILLSRVVHYDV